MKTLNLLLSLTWLALMPPLSAPATTLIPMDLGDLTDKAEAIFIGTVSDVRSEKDLGAIYTYVTFSDVQVIKGHLEGEVEVRLWGGTVAGETVRVFGMPQFVVGERNLVFLAGNRRFGCPIVGWGQGRFKVRWDEASGQEAVFDDRGVAVTAVRDRQVVPAKRTEARAGSRGLAVRGHVDTVEEVGLQPPLSLASFVRVIEAQMGIEPSVLDRKEERQ